jgi:hypothetical protein
MSLPEQIQKQVDEAKAIIAQRYGNQSDVTDVEEKPADPVEQVEEAPVAEAPVAQTRERVEEEPQTRENVTKSEDENDPTYAQRWRSLQGVYNATKRQMDEAQQRIANLEQLLSQMQTEKVDASIPKPSTHVTEKDVTEYGGDMVEFARRVAREEMSPLAQAVRMLMGKLEQLQGVVPVVQNVAQAQAQTAHDRFYEALTQRVADWKVVNDNPKFHDWLLSNDPLSGLQRQTLLVDAHNALDLERVVNIFEMGKQALGINRAPTPQQTATKAANVTKLEKQIAPGRASTATTPPQAQEKRQWTRPEIAQFFADKQRGKFKGREAEAQAMERDIFAAQREGRVVLNVA